MTDLASDSLEAPAAPLPGTDPGNPQGVIALVLGIVSVVIWVAGPFAVWMGWAGRRRVESGQTAQHYTSAVAGQTLGMIGTVIVVLYGALALLAVLAD
jgi:hypothetical protein